MPLLVCVCAGGLANRVRPLASYRALAENTGRQFAVIWREDRTCFAPFESLFVDSTLHFLGETQALALPRAKFYTRLDSLSNLKRLDPWLFGTFAACHCVVPLDLERLLADHGEVVLVLDNGPCAVDPTAYFASLARLRPRNEPEKAVDPAGEMIAVHLRLTDFRDILGISEADYARALRDAFGELDKKHIPWRHWALFVASDEPVGATLVQQVARRPVRTVESPVYVGKADVLATAWKTNTYRSAMSIAAAVQELELMARARIRVGFDTSSFFCLSREFAVARHMRTAIARAQGRFRSDNLREAVDCHLAASGLGPDVFLDVSPSSSALRRTLHRARRWLAPLAKSVGAG